MVELSGIINTDFMSKCQGTCKILVSTGCYCFAVEKSKKEHGQHILNEHQFAFPLIILSICFRILTVRSPSCRWDSTGLLGNMKVGIKY